MVPTELKLGIVAALVAALAMAQTIPARDPFAFFSPTVLSQRWRTREARQGRSGRQSGARSRSRDRDRFRSPRQCRRRSAHCLDAADRGSKKGPLRVRSGACGVKLSDEDIAHLRQTAAAAGTNWKPVVQEAFRGVVLARVQKYFMDGLPGLPPYHDQKTPVSLDAEFAAIVEESRFLVARQPDLTDYLTQYPRRASAGVESFFYWSKEALGGKPIITVTHVSIVRSADPGVPEARSWLPSRSSRRTT